MRRTVIGWSLLAMAFYLLMLILTLPAQRVAGWAGLPLADARGDLWQGSAAVVIGQEALEDLRWRLHLVWPWHGALGARVTATHRGWQAAGALTLGWNGDVKLTDASLAGPLDSPPVARRPPVPLGGMARLDIARATWRQGLLDAEGVRLEARGAQLRLGSPLALGDLVAEVRVIDGRVDGALRDLGGPLDLSGRLSGDARAGLSLNARLQARPDAPTELADALRLLPLGPDGGAHVQASAPAPWLAMPTN